MGEYLSRDNKLIARCRIENNWRIEDGDDPESKLVAVYCSSNGIYFPNDDETFNKRIILQDKYDWKTNRISHHVRKHVYIRDIYKQWYVEGINKEINSIEKVAEWIRNVSGEHAEFVFLGSSAGAYMSICLGSILGGVVFAASPQIYLKPEGKYPILLEHWLNNDLKWFDLREVLIMSKADNYIFFGDKNREDSEQIRTVSNLQNVHLIPIDTNLHGNVFFPFNVKYFYDNLEKLNRYSSKERQVRKMLFSFYIEGIVQTLVDMTKMASKKLIRKKRNEKRV